MFSLHADCSSAPLLRSVSDRSFLGKTA
jgi:hypothetical protein